MSYNLQHYQDLIYELTRKELAVRYKNLALGYVWSVASPLAYAFVYYLVFQLILKVEQPNYALFLVAGLYPWQWISNSMGQAPMTFVSNSSLIKKTLFPRFLIPFVSVAQDAIHFGFTLPILLALALYFGSPPSATWIWAFPLIFLAQLIMIYGLHLLISTLTLFFRDLERFVQIAMTFTFYLTPILYSESMIPAEYQHLIGWNPFATLMINWRHMFLDNEINFYYLGLSYIWAFAFVFLGHWAYKKLSWRFAEIL